MNDVKINYIIASYNGITGSRLYEYSEKVLDFQLQNLRNIMDKKKKNNIECLVKKITIIIADYNIIINTCPKYILQKRFGTDTIPTFKNYYLFDKWNQMFSDIEISFQPYYGINNHFSYDQWIKGISSNIDKFTHHIIIEDDYCIDPNSINFDTQLIDIYKTKFKDNIGFLSEKCVYDKDIGYHSSISNGMISSDTIKKINNPLSKFYEYTHYPQISFSYLFIDNEIPITDYSEYFKITFWNPKLQKLQDFSENKNLKEECFTPIEKIILNLN